MHNFHEKGLSGVMETAEMSTPVVETPAVASPIVAASSP